MQRKPVKIGGDIITGTIIAQVVLSLPGWIHDEVIRPGDDLEAHQTRREERLDDLIALGGLRWVVKRIGQEPTDRADELFHAMSVPLENRVLEVER